MVIYKFFTKDVGVAGGHWVEHDQGWSFPVTDWRDAAEIAGELARTHDRVMIFRQETEENGTEKQSRGD